MVTVFAEDLKRDVRAILDAAGCPEVVSTRVADSLVESNLVGHDSHGVMRVPFYLDAIRAGTLHPDGRIEIVGETPATTLLDCGWNFGQVAAAQGMEMAIQKASALGIGMTVLRHCDHTGRIGEYVVTAAQQDMMGLVFCNGSIPGGLVAPFGGVERALGANPLAWSIPAGANPIFLDFATAAVAHGKLEVAADKGELVAEGLIVDKHGNPTRDPHAEIDGGAILPFGGHKGYALGVMIELVGGGLSGVGFPLVPGYRWDQGTVLMAVNIAVFQPMSSFEAMIQEFRERIKAVRRAPGVQEILLPGELEWKTKAQREREGIPIPEATWQRIREYADAFGL
jgi:uncharacterized oxidoreductase